MTSAAGTLLDMRRRGGGVSRYGDRWRARAFVDGREISLGLFDDEASARAAVAAAHAQLGTDLALPGARLLSHWGPQWLDVRELHGIRGVRQERSVWRAHVQTAPFADLPMASISRPMVVRWIATLLETDLSRQTVKHALRVLKGALAGAVDAGHLEANVAKDVHVPRVTVAEDAKPSVTWLTLDEIAKLLGAEEVPQWARDVWAVAIYTGLRKGELAGLRWRDVHLDGPSPHLAVQRSYAGPTKSGKGRIVPLLPPALDALRRIRARAPGIGEREVWPAPSGGVWAAHWDPGGWRRYACGMTRPDSGGVLDRHVRFHDLRHTCASHLVQGTWLARPMDLYSARQWLGHSSIGVTQRYAHLAPGGLHDLAALWTGNEPADRQGREPRK